MTKLVDLKPIQLTAKEFKALDANGLATLLTEPRNLISENRAKTLLVTRIRTEKLNSITPESIMDWTYKGVQIEGVTQKIDGAKAENAKVTLTQKEFDALDANGKADLIKEYTNPRRVAGSIFPEIVKKGLPLTAEDVVHVTNGRILVEGVTVSKTSRPTRPAIVAGITFAP